MWRGEDKRLFVEATWSVTHEQTTAAGLSFRVTPKYDRHEYKAWGRSHLRIE